MIFADLVCFPKLWSLHFIYLAIPPPKFKQNIRFLVQNRGCKNLIFAKRRLRPSVLGLDTQDPKH